MRQIDADELLLLYEGVDESLKVSLRVVKQNIKDMPTIEAEPRWIPCSERMPEKPFGCLVTVWDTEPMTGEEFENILPYFIGWDGEQWNDADGEQCPFEVIAWMPLPKPYSEGEE